LRERVVEVCNGLQRPSRILILACDHGGAARYIGGRVPLPCVAMAPPSLIDYALSKDLADGVVIAGCAESACFHRLGVAWTKARVAGQRDPYLRARVPRERVRMIWTSALETRRFEAELKAFAAQITQLAPARLRSPLPPSVGPVKMAKQVAVAGRSKG
jgi:coenzyme F420-reducing hydrogenase delta subunit